MRMLKYFMPLVAVAALSSGIASVVYSPDDYDVHALKQVEKNKSVINVLNKGNNLFLSGDIRAKWATLDRKTNGVDELGSGTGKPNNLYLSDVNLLVDYDASCAWGQVKLSFRNCLGTESGTYNNVTLERAFIGYDFLPCGDWDLYAEVGRQKMDYLFESEVMYNSTFDGILVGVDYAWDSVGDMFVHGGGFVIDNKADNYGWVGELGFMEIADTGLYAKYSFIHWRQKGVDAYGVHDSPNLRFNVSHLVMGYVFQPDVLRVPTRIFGAALVNHSAKSNAESANKKANWGWYAGVEMGKLEVAGDWSVNINYQWVDFQAMPSADVSGIGRGYYAPYNGYANCGGGSCPTTSCTTECGACPLGDSIELTQPLKLPIEQATPEAYQGNTNFKGVEATAFYNVTSNLALRACFKASNQVTKAIGGSHKFRDFELGAVYSF